MHNFYPPIDHDNQSIASVRLLRSWWFSIVDTGTQSANIWRCRNHSVAQPYADWVGCALPANQKPRFRVNLSPAGSLGSFRSSVLTTTNWIQRGARSPQTTYWAVMEAIGSCTTAEFACQGLKLLYCQVEQDVCVVTYPSWECLLKLCPSCKYELFS